VAKYNTMFDVAFEVDHDEDDPQDVPVEKLLDAVEKRLRTLRANLEEAAEAFGVCDTYSNEKE
jgi:hypothetical protein